MSDLATVRDTLGRCYDAVEALTADLRQEEWRVQSLCPDWTVHGVVAHLVSVEEILAGWLPQPPTPPADGQGRPSLDGPAFGRLGSVFAELSDLPDSSLAERAREVFGRRRADLLALDAADLDRPTMTPVGPGTYGRFMDIRVFDFWVHERDITIPLGRPATDDTGIRAELSVDEVRRSLGYIVGKKIGLPDGKSIVFHLTGPLRTDLAAVVEGRARPVESVENPDVEVTSDTTTFMLLACGRIDPQGPIDSGAIRWSGDAEWGERAARQLAFTI